MLTASKSPVAKATDYKLPEIDYALCLEIIDLEKADTESLSTRTIKWQLKNDKRQEVRHHTLNLMAFMFENCGPRFQYAILSDEYTTFLRKIVDSVKWSDVDRTLFGDIVVRWVLMDLEPGLKARANMLVMWRNEKYARLVLGSPMTSGGHPGYTGTPSGYPAVYSPVIQLMPPPVGFVPIVPHYPLNRYFTPEQLSESSYNLPQSVAASPYASPPLTPPPVHMERRAVIERDLDLAESNVRLLSETLTFCAPGEDVRKNELVQEFREKCLEIQKRVQRLTEEVEEPEL
ncbi:hypothetical protein HKX48_003258, partial [Thoreauomyces humboldtii]